MTDTGETQEAVANTALTDAHRRVVGPRRSDSSSSSSPLWELLSSKVAECGLTLFDLEVPTSMSGSIRVFLWRAPAPLMASRALSEVSSLPEEENHAVSVQESASAQATEPPAHHKLTQQGVTLDDCARVAKHLQAFMDSPDGAALGLSSEQWGLEVSSPGINRTLKRAEHFNGACGERISVRFNPDAAEFIVREPSTTGKKRTKKSQSPAQRAERAEKLIATIQKKRVMQGVLVAAMPEHIEVQDDDGLLQVRIPRRAVVHARVDFLFDQR